MSPAKSITLLAALTLTGSLAHATTATTPAKPTAPAAAAPHPMAAAHPAAKPVAAPAAKPSMFSRIMGAAKPAAAPAAKPVAHHTAAVANGRMVTTRTTTGKTITYNCSKAGNANKKACG